MDKAINDATLNKIGDIFQYYIALKDCFKMDADDTLQIEINGDVSIISNVKSKMQKEVKHHLKDVILSDRDIDFWKTLANWYEDYSRINIFSQLILHTTAKITRDSVFSNWNDKTSNQKLTILRSIGVPIKKREAIFREQFSRIFNESYDEDKLIAILGKFSIEHSQHSIVNISNDFAGYVAHIPDANRDNYIGALLGQILAKVKDPPHKWSVSRREFERILQSTSPSFEQDRQVPLPLDYAKAEVPPKAEQHLESKRFIDAIREIKHDQVIPKAISDYWKADMTIARYFQDNIVYLQDLSIYEDSLRERLFYSKENFKMDAEGVQPEESIKISKRFYNDTMNWNSQDFGSIIRNQDYFQRGIIHNIIDDGKIDWNVGDKK